MSEGVEDLQVIHEAIMRRVAGIGRIIVLVGMPVIAQAMHPLITDDAKTQGAGKFQFEVNGSHSADRETIDGITSKSTEAGLVSSLTYGVGETVDLFIDVPYVRSVAKEDGVILHNVNGPSDISVGAKWRFFENEGTSFAVKPLVSLPSGDEERGLGAGRTGYGAYLVATKDFEPEEVEVFLNIGYFRNGNKAGESTNIWHASLAVVYEPVEDLYLAVNAGMEKNPDRAADEDPAFGLVGIVYEAGEDLDLSLGFKMGLNDAEADRTALAGVTVRF